jgi:hypothetical protein
VKQAIVRADKDAFIINVEHEPSLENDEVLHTTGERA